MKNIGKYTKSEIGTQSPGLSDNEPITKKKYDEQIQVSIQNKEPKVKPKVYKDEEAQSSQEDDEEANPIKKNELLRSSGSSYFNNKSISKSKYRTVEDLYRNNKQPIIYSNDPSGGRKIKNYAQLNQSLNKKYSDSEKDYKKLLKSKSKLDKNNFNPSVTHKPKNLKHAMNILLDKD